MNISFGDRSMDLSEGNKLLLEKGSLSNNILSKKISGFKFLKLFWRHCKTNYWIFPENRFDEEDWDNLSRNSKNLHQGDMEMELRNHFECPFLLRLHRLISELFISIARLNFKCLQLQGNPFDFLLEYSIKVW